MIHSKEVKFSSSVIRKFHNLVEVPARIQAKVSSLEDMEELFEASSFQYNSMEDRLLGMKYLLGTWEIIITNIKGLRTRDQYVFYRIITKVIARKEFYLETCDFNPDELTVASAYLVLLKQFSHLLLTTFFYCQSILHETVSPVPVLFASKIIALSYYRLPSIHHLINTCFLQLYPSSTFDSVKRAFDLTDAHSQPTANSNRPSSLKSPTEVRSTMEADRFSERSTVTVDFSHDIIYSTVAPSPSPTPPGSEFSPIPERISPDLTEGLLDDIPVDIKSLSALKAKNYTKRLKHQLSRYSHHPDTQSFIRMKLPSLFYWMQVVEEEEVEGIESESWWLDRLKVCDSLLFDIIRSRCDILRDYQHYSGTKFALDVFPCHTLFLRCFVPSFQHAVLQKYDCGQQRRTDASKANEYLTAGIKTSCAYLEDPDVTSMLFAIVMSECNVYIPSDVTAFFVYLNTWCDEITNLSLIAHDRNEEVRGTILEGIQHFLSSNPNCTELQLGKYLVESQFCCDIDEAYNILTVLKREDVLISSGSQHLLQNVLPAFQYRETPLFSLPIYFPYFTFYSSLFLILEQDHLFVLKRGLLFLYQHADLFIGNYRYYFYSQLFNQFPHLFAHWDANVRLVFHHILLYRVLVSLQRTVPHLTADHLLSFLNETAVETVLKGLHGVDRRTRSICSRMVKRMKWWKRKYSKKNPWHELPIIETNSIEHETMSIDLVLASKIDANVIKLITEFNEPEKYKVPRHHIACMFIAIAEYVLLLTEYEKIERRMSSRAKIRPPVFETSFILCDPKQT